MKESNRKNGVSAWFSKTGRSVSDFFYGVSVKLHRELKKESSVASVKARDMLFYIILLAFPVAQFCVFYLGVNLNSILLTFKEYDGVSGAFRWSGLENLAEVFRVFGSKEFSYAWKNTFIVYFTGLIVGTPLALFFSFYIYKKMFGHGFFKVILFVPSIISAVVMVMIFRNFTELVIPDIAKKLFGAEMNGLLSDPKTVFGTLLFFSVWVGFGTGILMYSGAMSGISDSVVEAAKLEGASSVREFFSITLPLIWPTVVTFLVVGVAQMFVNQFNLYTFYGDTAEPEIVTIGYYLFARTANTANLIQYPFLAAMGVVLTFIAVPLTLGARFLLEKFGPSAD